MRCPGPKRSNKYLAPDAKEVLITFLSDLMAQIELSCHISHLSFNVFGWSGIINYLVINPVIMPVMLNYNLIAYHYLTQA